MPEALMFAGDAWLRLVLAVLATWRVTHFFVNEDGPWEVVTRLRRRAGESFWGRLMDCFYCVSVWVGSVFALAAAASWREWPLYWLAISGAACLLERSGRKEI
jgi:Protein of unknown function (DUF1360)